MSRSPLPETVTDIIDHALVLGETELRSEKGPGSDFVHGHRFDDLTSGKTGPTGRHDGEASRGTGKAHAAPLSQRQSRFVRHCRLSAYRRKKIDNPVELTPR